MRGSSNTFRRLLGGYTPQGSHSPHYITIQYSRLSLQQHRSSRSLEITVVYIVDLNITTAPQLKISGTSIHEFNHAAADNSSPFDPSPLNKFSPYHVNQNLGFARSTQLPEQTLCPTPIDDEHTQHAINMLSIHASDTSQ